jgi:peptidylprolyl isomerase
MRRYLSGPVLSVLLVGAVTVGAAGCSSKSGTSSGGRTEKSEASPSASAPAYNGAIGAVPEVTGATDLTKAPTIAAGTGTPPTSLIVKDLVVGTGATATGSSTVSVRYVGTNYADGKVFDASWTSGTTPAQFPLNGVIPGFGKGIVGMKVGGRRLLVIPPAQGYGSQGSQSSTGAQVIAPNETLVFVVDLVAVS